MAKFVKLNVQHRELNRMFDDLPDITKKAVANTLNKVTRKANKSLKEYVTSEYNIPKKSISMKSGGLVSIKRADARHGALVATIFIKRVGRGLFKFDAVQVGSDVRVKIKKSPKIIKNAFLSVWRQGQKKKWVTVRDESLGIAARPRKGNTRGTLSFLTQGGFYKATKRRGLFGPMIADLYTSRRAQGVIDKVFIEEFQPLLDEEFNRQVEKKRR